LNTRKASYRYRIYVLLTIILCITPLALGYLLKIPIFDISNGSNDGWLGFWGGYLGAIIAVLGVFWQVNRQQGFEKIKEDEKNRPFVDFSIQYGIKENDKIYHSSNSVGIDDYRGFFYRVRNILDVPALNVFFCIYAKGSRNPVNVIVVQSIRNEAILVDPSLPRNIKISKIEICYQTTRNEFGLLHSRSTNQAFLKLPKRIYGYVAKYRFDEAIKRLNVHNKKYETSITKVWRQNISIFSKEDLDHYREIDGQILKHQIPALKPKIRDINDRIT
jgi:hypothetical protein